jgi:hypothetical protein
MCKRIIAEVRMDRLQAGMHACAMPGTVNLARAGRHFTCHLAVRGELRAQRNMHDKLEYLIVVNAALFLYY